jgi:hypothetical protein
MPRDAGEGEGQGTKAPQDLALTFTRRCCFISSELSGERSSVGYRRFRTMIGRGQQRTWLLLEPCSDSLQRLLVLLQLNLGNSQPIVA